MPIANIVQPKSEARFNLLLLSASVRSKAEAATDVAAARAGGLYDQPVVSIHMSKELAARLSLPTGCLTVMINMRDHLGAYHDSRASAKT